MKSRILLKGVYEKNTDDKEEDMAMAVTDLIKEKGNYRKEVVKICEIYD